MILLWSIVSFDYYVITFYVKYLNGVIFYLNIVQCLAEIAGYFFSGFLAHKFNNKTVLISCFGLAALFGALQVIFEDQGDWVTYVAILVIKFTISSAFNAVFIANSELFPTIYLGTSFGFVNVFARTATILAP